LTAENHAKSYAGGEEDDASIFDLQAEDNEAYIPNAAMDSTKTRLIMEIIDELASPFPPSTKQRSCTGSSSSCCSAGFGCGSS